DRIARVVTLLADAEAPAVFHCAAGKDRTGVVSAIVLGLLGVPDEVIVADYAATRESLDAIVGRLNPLEGYRTMLAALPPHRPPPGPSSRAWNASAPGSAPWRTTRRPRASRHRRSRACEPD